MSLGNAVADLFTASIRKKERLERRFLELWFKMNELVGGSTGTGIATGEGAALQTIGAAAAATIAAVGTAH